MIWKIGLSKEAVKFLQKRKIAKEEVIELVKKSIKKLQGEDTNIDIKKLKGEWLGFYRARIGRTRVIMEINFDAFSVLVERIEFRGGAYKD